MRGPRAIGAPRGTTLQIIVLFTLATPALTFSGGGGNGQQPTSGAPALVQSCDAINICGAPPAGVCPSGMTLVAPPERSSTYTLRTADKGLPSNDPTSYIPGELMTLYLRVTARHILGKEDAGRRIVGNETAKYIGLLLYAVDQGDASETKVGDWEPLLEERQKFWRPPDMPGCARKAVMHAGPEEKNYLERFYFRAPPVGTGPITFRALVKQGETNKGAFYWPVAPASATPDLTPVDGRSNGDLTLTEGSPRAPTPWSYRGSVGETCTQVCARYSGMVCDEAALSATDTPVELSAAVASSFVCALPLLATCGSSAPRMSGLGDGLCWYREDTCAARPSLACDATPPADFESGLRLCPCVPPSGRRRLDVNNTSDGSGGDAAKRPSGLQELPDYKEFDINADGRPVHRPRVDDINDDSVLHVLEAEAELAAPCEPSPADALLSSPPARLHHGERGGSPARCPSMRAARREVAIEETPLGPLPLTFVLSVAAGLLLVAIAVSARLLWRGRRHEEKPTGTPRVRVFWRPRKPRRMLAALFSLVGLPTASPHNWARSCGSRGGMAASTIKPCPPIRSHFPHIQVNAEQKFVMEWATGHGGAQFWVFLKQEDFGKLRGISRRILWQYFAQAPPEAWAYFNDVRGFYKNPNASANMAWRKIHLRRYPNLPPNTIQSDNMYRLDPNNPFYVPQEQFGLPPTWSARPWGRSRWTYLGYTDAKHCGTRGCGQRRVWYNNTNWPWIRGVHMFSIPWVYARSADAAQFAFPPGTEPGQYIAYFLWAGYRDCVDIDLLPDTKPVPFTFRGVYGYSDPARGSVYTKTDHSQCAPPHLPTLPTPLSRPNHRLHLAGTQWGRTTSSQALTLSASTVKRCTMVHLQGDGKPASPSRPRACETR